MIHVGMHRILDDGRFVVRVHRSADGTVPNVTLVAHLELYRAWDPQQRY
jgi:hypothetical protein